MSIMQSFSAGGMAAAAGSGVGLNTTSSLCDAFNPPSTLSVPYWEQADKCGACVATPGCGFCHSTMQCLAGTSMGPSAIPCPDWIIDATECPIDPHCEKLVDCTTCVTSDACAWCASSTTCMTIEETYDSGCRGTVFDPPCPATYVADNKGIYWNS
jgi:hypothetical protein